MMCSQRASDGQALKGICFKKMLFLQGLALEEQSPVGPMIPRARLT